MVSAIVSVNGKILPVDIKRGRAVYAGTRIPVVNENKLQELPEKGKVEGLIKEAQEAQAKETELQSYWRACEERANQEPLDVREGILKLIREGSKWEFSELLEETNPPIEALWKDEDIKELFIQIPEESLIAKKILEQNYSFTLTEARQLLKLNPAKYPTDLIVALGEISPVFSVEALHKRLSNIVENNDSETILSEFAKISPHLQIQLLRSSYYSLIKQSISKNLTVVAKLFLEKLSEQERITVLSTQSYRLLKDVVSTGSIDMVKTTLELLPLKERSLALRYNHAKLLRVACQMGRRDLVKQILDIANSLDVKLPKTMIRSKNYEACLIAAKAGRAEIISHFKKYIKIPNRILKKPFIPKGPESERISFSALRKSQEKANLSNPIELRISNPHPDLNKETLEKYYPVMQVADGLEKTEDAKANAHKLAILFPNEEEGIKWLTRRVNRQFQASNQPLHDAMLFTVPTSHDWNPKDWGTLLRRLGDEVLDCLPLAPRLEKAYREMGGKEVTGLDFCKLNINDLISLSSRVSYIGADANKNFAAFCSSIKPKVTQEGFERGIRAIEHVRKHPEVVDNDAIPEIGIIDGADFGHPDFYMRKLSKASEYDLMVSLTIGRFVRCCNHLDGATSAMAMAQTTSQNGGVYALYRKEDGEINSKSLPVGKTTVWRGKDSITFNSWEYPDMKTEFKDMGRKFLIEAAARAISMDETIEDVTLGGKNPGLTSRVVTPKKPIDPSTKSPDSNSQILITTRNDYKKKQIAQLQQKTIESLKNIPEEEASIIPIKFLAIEKNFPIILAS